MVFVRIFISSLVLALVAVRPLPAQHGGHSSRETEEIHRHHFAVLAGGSHNTKKDGSTIGADYEYRFNHPLGVLASFEYVGGDFREDVFAFTAAWHPWKGLRLIAGPGFDRELKHPEETHHTDNAHAAAPEHHGRYRALFRTGAAWEFHWKEHVTFGPEIAVDVLKGEKVFVYGINIGWGFGRR
ncbi:MAG: hypothetical protein KatS3mg005_0734 [Bryobacteraceae bacterium]|nr:MAG: hypothetical protein KatS3mg005_0734 [Bryobacteraceae bacterium]